MPRTIQVSTSAEQIDRICEQVRGLDGVIGLALQREASLQPPGDILTIHSTNDGTRAVLAVLAELNVREGGTILTSEPRSLMSLQHQSAVDQESNETIWDEMAFLLRRETNISVNYLALMALSGAVAAVGLWTNTVHIVVGAMVLAPGFEPILRIPFGWIAGPRVFASRGAKSTLLGYLSLALAGLLTFFILRVVDPATTPDLTTRTWVQYWSSITASDVLLALIAGTAGAVVVTAQRSVLTAGVMIALALIPSMTIAGMALGSGNLPLAGSALLRWAVEAGAVIAASALVLGLKQALLHRRQALS